MFAELCSSYHSWYKLPKKSVCSQYYMENHCLLGWVEKASRAVSSVDCRLQSAYCLRAIYICLICTRCTVPLRKTVWSNMLSHENGLFQALISYFCSDRQERHQFWDVDLGGADLWPECHTPTISCFSTILTCPIMPVSWKSIAQNCINALKCVYQSQDYIRKVGILETDQVCNLR